MFTWIPIHEEAAQRLLDYKDRSYELIKPLERMQLEELKTINLTDQDEEGKPFQLKEIDPFTFLANFNRGTRDENRKGLWKALKDEWKLQAEVPQDFEGLPLADMRSSWLMPYAGARSPEHVPLLWQFFEHIMSVAPEALDAALMQRCLNLRQVGLANLTMGMFWSCPKKWIAADGRNTEFANAKGIQGKPKTATEYLTWFLRVREVIADNGVEFSSHAYRSAKAAAAAATIKEALGRPFNIMFANGEANRILDVFADALKIIEEELGPDTKLLAFTFGSSNGTIPELRINIGQWAVLSYHNRSGSWRFHFILPTDHPEIIKQGSKGQFAVKVDGKGYTHGRLTTAEFFERHAELWPAIDESLRAACKRFSNQRATAFRRFHRPELVALVTDPIERARLLNEGLKWGSQLTPPGEKRQYWLVALEQQAQNWEEWIEQEMATIGWPELGDLQAYADQDEILSALSERRPSSNSSGDALSLHNFAARIRPGDVLFARLGRSEILGWGEVQGPYAYDEERTEQPNFLPVAWAKPKAIKLPEDRVPAQKTLLEITNESNLLTHLSAEFPGIPGLEDRAGEETRDDVIGPPATLPPYGFSDALADLFMAEDALERILEQLRRKKNIILQGAPGVGKTYVARRLAWLLLGARNDSAIEMVQFHQSYTYEDFVQGLRPNDKGHFAVKDGVFYRLCRAASANPGQDFVLVIDEINRGNLSKILGELMMLIETDKRGQELTLAYNERDRFTVPPNLYLIGTMNTADRSLSLVDYALRRRFAFLTLDPCFGEKTFATHLERHGLTSRQIDHVRWQMEALNQEIEKDEVNLGKGYRIGHSFFTPDKPVSDFRKWYHSIVHYEILPLIEEYWIDDPRKVEHYRSALTDNMP